MLMARGLGGWRARIVGLYGATGKANNAGWRVLPMLLLLWGAAAQAALAAERPVLVLLGDSLTAGYGLPAEEAFPAQLERALAARGLDVEIRNAGVSGDTSAGGLARLDWAVGPDADAVVVELGANDALRGVDPAETERNLDAILRRLTERGLKVLLAGMYAPPNLGAEYAHRFNAIYPRLAEKYDVPLYPFFLDGVALDPALNQADRIHPNAAGVEIIAEQIAPAVAALLRAQEGAFQREAPRPAGQSQAAVARGASSSLAGCGSRAG